MQLTIFSIIPVAQMCHSGSIKAGKATNCMRVSRTEMQLDGVRASKTEAKQCSYGFFERGKLANIISVIATSRKMASPGP